MRKFKSWMQKEFPQEVFDERSSEPTETSVLKKMDKKFL